MISNDDKDRENFIERLSTLLNMPGRFLFVGISAYIHLNPFRVKAVVDLKERGYQLEV